MPATEFIESDQPHIIRVENEETAKFLGQPVTPSSVQPVYIEDLWSQIGYCFKRKAIRSLMVIFSLGYGLIVAFGALSTAILGCFNYREISGPIMSCGLIICGLFGSILYSTFFLKSSRQYRNIFPITGLSTIITFSLLINLINQSPIWLVMIIGCSLGFVALNLNVLVLEELIRRLDPKLLVPVSVLNSMLSQILAAAMIYISGFFVEEDNTYNGSLVVLLYGLIFAFIFGYCFLAESRLANDRLPIQTRQIKAN